MRGLVVFGFLISTIIVCVLSDNGQPDAQDDTSAVAVRADQLTHGHRSKRSPYDAVVPGILLGKSFLLGALVGKSLRRGWGWAPRRPRGWGWSSGGGWSGWKSAPVVVHSHSHGGWGGWSGWSEPVVSSGWGWAR
ncbi:hypothetical protein Ocin01_11055 [Orchesella cincta]|uniref:Secreted protein n=1 Tax=Orchesella cincta TaxID=48709 RepID=A0A1D2MS42_ORCCI|nr:hypothetical protein Ocin01_11055 [Orchesella cincta]